MSNDTLHSDFFIYTDGRGLWSRAIKAVNCTSLVLDTYTVPMKKADFGELRVYFDPKSWDIEKDGLIYTDDRWLDGLHGYLEILGFSKDAAKDVDYSEQGMQGDDYVSLDVNEVFIKSWIGVQLARAKQ